MKPVVVLQNEPDAPAAYLGDALDRRGIEWIALRLDAGELLPDPESVSGVAALGGAMGAYDEDAHPFLVAEKRFLAACVKIGIPVLGICLGCQLLADALGGRAYLADSAEVVFAPVQPTSCGDGDPIVAALTGRRVIRFHQDTFDLPPGATLLATGGGFNHAFRLGTAVGIQPHPEVTPALLGGWLADGDARQMAIDSGTDPDGLVGTFAAAEAEVMETAAAVFDAWIDEIV
ncbi:MAG: type 1 glutamine amidotransferase [Acidimicrobiia bacterium]|jgi:GMP synthase (glutamine-hydrolysing)